MIRAMICAMNGTLSRPLLRLRAALIARFALALLAALFLARPALAAVEIREVTSPGGITAWLVEEHSIPFVALDIRFRGGASLDAPGKRGATALMAWTLEEGTGEMDSRAFAAAAEALAASYRFSITDDALTVSARFLTENRDAAADLLRRALVAPRFDAEAVERVRAQVLSGIRDDMNDPGAIASATFNRLAWGDHPYGSDKAGTLDSVAALTRDDLVAAHKAAVARDRVFIGVVGDITAADLGPLLDRLLGDLPATGVPMPPVATYQLPPGVTVVPWDSPQSIAIFGERGIRLEDPDYLPAMVLNEAVGGGNFSSILMNEVREKRGLTYGIGTYLATMDLGELLAGQFASANGKMAEALDVVRQVWADVARDGITEAQLEDAKTYLTGAYPLRFDGNATIAGIIAGMQMTGLPIDYPRFRNEKIEAVTMDDIRRVAARLWRVDDLGIVVVGHPDGVESTP